MQPVTTVSEALQIAEQIDKEFSEKNVFKHGFSCLGVGKKRPCLRVKRPKGELCARCLKDALQKVAPYHRVRSFYESVVDSASKFVLIRHMEANKESYDKSHEWISFNSVLQVVFRDFEEHLAVKKRQLKYFAKIAE